MINSFYRRKTSRFRSSPNFLIVGSQKGGTTSLAYYISKHPEVFISEMKELNYFNLHENFTYGDYKSHFPLFFNNKKAIGEATPDYMIYPQVAEKVKSFNKKMKIIFLLKDPVMRAFSHYKHNLMMNREWMSFSEAIENEEKRCNLEFIDINKSHKDAIKNYCNFAYLRKGIYHEQLVPWLNHFSKDQILVVQSEMFFAETQRCLNLVHDFLGVKEHSYESFEVKNKSNIQEVFPDDLKAELYSYFEPFNEKLNELLSMNFSWKNNS